MKNNIYPEQFSININIMCALQDLYSIIFNKYNKHISEFAILNCKVFEAH